MREDAVGYELSVPLNHPFTGIFTDELVVEVMLPEGARDVEIEAPREISNVVISSKKSWLDTPLVGGRVLARFTSLGGFVVNQREALVHRFTVKYKLGWFWKIRPALLLSFYFFVILSMIAMYMRSYVPMSEATSPIVLSRVGSEQEFETVEESEPTAPDVQEVKVPHKKSQLKKRK